MTTAAVMQPYFFPYAGYYRLAALADIFVIYDCVQFPRRGRVHRCQLPALSGKTEWLTLPLAKQPRDVAIRDLLWARDARAELDRRLLRYPWLHRTENDVQRQIGSLLHAGFDSYIGFLTETLRLTFQLLSLSTRVIRSSSLSIDPMLRGQQRVLAIVKAVGATHYLNAPGGIGLYQHEMFTERGCHLHFLQPYEGSYSSLLHALFHEPIASVRMQICHEDIPAESSWLDRFETA